MGLNGSEGDGNHRRKSMRIFSRSSSTGLTQLDTQMTSHKEVGKQKQSKDEPQRLMKRSSLFSIGPPPINESRFDGAIQVDLSNSLKAKHSTVQKSRPPSFLGSLSRKSITSTNGGEADSIPPSPKDDGMLRADSGIPYSTSVRHHGEVLTTSGVFRKKKEYLVLTDTHLLRFKSQAKALEAFPALRRQLGRQSTPRHPSTTSISSLQDIQSINSHSSGEREVRIPLGQIVTAHRVMDGRPFFTSEVVYLDEENYSMGTFQTIFDDPKEADLWLSSIRGAAQQVRVRKTEPYPERIVEYLVRVIEDVDDYDPQHFKVFRVYYRLAGSKGRSSNNISKMGLFYMVIGIHRVHLVPVPDLTDHTTLTVTTKASMHSFGLVALVGVYINVEDDRFELAFRTPLKRAKTLLLAASATSDIALEIVRAAQYLRPQWLEHSFHIGAPKHLHATIDEPVMYDDDDELGSFERTLTAYCLAFDSDPTNIKYAIDYEVDDAPAFRLFEPVKGTKYTLHELLAIFRALRYNEWFRTISFAGNDLHCLHGLHDTMGVEHVALTTRGGLSIKKYFKVQPGDRSLLYQEVQALAMKSTTLRRMDFADCLPRRRPRDTFDVEEEGVGTEKDPGCEIVAALLPLCKLELTNVDWVVLSGIELGETDLDDIIPTLNAPISRLRALECARSGLNDRGVMQMLGHLERQNANLECINIADNPGRIHLERFKISMSCFSNLRKLDLSRITRTLGEEPLFPPEVMLSWRLEELTMNGVPVNDKTLDTISAYLASDMSDRLRLLEMDQCNLSGAHVAILMRSMTRKAGVARNLELHVSTNKIEKGVGKIAKAIEENHTPSELIIRMIEFSKDEHLRQLLKALRKNITIRALDISKASLPYDASPETCEALKLVFEQNKTLQYFDISGEQAHLEVTRFGIGLNQALTGLRNNTSLKVLRIEHQNLGLEGANTLSSVLETNTGLEKIECEHNNINLQGFTILVNAIARNYTVLDLPLLDKDKEESMKQWKRETSHVSSHSNEHHMRTSVRRTLSTLGVSRPQKTEPPSPDLDTVVRVLQDKWDTEMDRLRKFLLRNRMMREGQLAQVSEEALRPTTALSDSKCIEQAIQEITPTVELGDPVDAHVTKLGGMRINSSNSTKEENEKKYNGALVDDEKRSLQHSSDGSIDTSTLQLRSINPSEKLFEVDDRLFKMNN